MRDKTHILAAMCAVSRTKRRGSVGAGSASESNGSRIEERGEEESIKANALRGYTCCTHPFATECLSGELLDRGESILVPVICSSSTAQYRTVKPQN